MEYEIRPALLIFYSFFNVLFQRAGCSLCSSGSDVQHLVQLGVMRLVLLVGENYQRHYSELCL